MKATRSIHSVLLACLGAGVLVADQAQAATLRYRLSGDWAIITDGSGPGWGLTPNNSGVPGTSLPGVADVGRINWGNNTVTLTTTEAIGRLQVGVDERGNLVIANGATLTTVAGSGQNGDVIIGNGNNPAGTGVMTVQSGGTLNVAGILYHGNLANGTSEISGTANVTSHLWTGWGAGITGTINVNSGGVLNVSGQLGLNWQNNGAVGRVNVKDGGVLNLAQIHPTDSIRGTSVLDISGSGIVTIPSDFTAVMSAYTNALKITSYGGLGTVGIDYNNTNVGKTTLFAIAPLVGPPTNAVWNPALNVGDGNGLWNVSTNWDVAAVPASVTKVQFKVPDAIPCTVTNAAVANQLVMGDNGPGGTLILTNGGSLTTGGGIWSAVGYNNSALMIVNSGCSASFGNHLWIGLNPGADGTLVINGGTVSVGGAFGMGTGGGTGHVQVNGGMLSLAQWADFGSVVGTSVLDVSGTGQVVMNGNHKLSVEVDVLNGLITADGGAGTAMVDYNNVHVGKTTIYALGANLTPEQSVWNPALIFPDINGLWNVSSNWSGGFAPGSGTKVVFKVPDAIPCLVTNAVTTGRVVMGDNGPGGTLIITNGGSLNTEAGDWTGVGYNSNALMIVSSGCSANFGNHLWVGLNPGADGTLVINGGTVSVASMFGLGWEGGTGMVQVNDGTLNLAQWSPSRSISGASVLDVTGTGKVRITGDQTASVSNYVSSGRITANGGPNVYYGYDSGANITTISATALAPPRQSITGISVGGGNATVTYQTTAGNTYRIESTPSLAPASWTTVPGSATNATGGPVTFVIPLPPGTNTLFFRTVSP